MKRISLYSVSIFIIIAFAFFAFRQQNSSLDTWIGEYTYSESFPAGPPGNPNERYGTIDYKVTIYKDNNNYYAEIKNEGYQTNINVLANVAGSNDSIDLLFDSYLPDNAFESFEKDELLLAFSKNGNELFTTWKAIESNTSILSGNNTGV